MKRSLIWTTAGIAALGLGVPAFAAANGNTTRPTAPASVNVTMATTATENTVKNSGADSARDIAEMASVTPTSVDDNATANSVDDATENSVEDVSGNCDEAEHANDPACTAAVQGDDNEADDDSADDDATENSVEDVSGNCDEAEHANDPSCTGAAAADDDSANGGNDDSGHGSDDSGHGGNDG